MEIKTTKNKIIIKNIKDFDIKKSLECGQIFRYKQISTNEFIVFETDNKIIIKQENEDVEIITKDPNKHIIYFDLKTNYDIINKRIAKFNPLFACAVEFGKGIRIFKQNFLEMLISFIISANNNIPRITKSLFNLCEKYGEKKEDYYAFPTLSSLRKISEKQWQELGTGYRAKSLNKVCSQIDELYCDKIQYLPTEEARRELIKLAGVGPKVADCVLLFALNKKDVFPTDTWVKKICVENLNCENKSAKEISLQFREIYKEDSGIIQQYLFYYKREKGDINE